MAETQALQHSDTPPERRETRLGRPTTYNEATAVLICERLAGGETLTAICKTPGMPKRQTVHRWRRKYPDFDDQYARARVDQMESWSDDIIEIADDDTHDTVTVINQKGDEYEQANSANVQRARLQVDTRKFLMSKIAPRYADKIEHQHTGGIEHRVTMSDRERMRRLATFMLEDKAAGALIDGQTGQPVTDEAQGE